MATKKRVLVSTWAFPPSPAGSAVILYELLRHMVQDEMVAVHTIGDPPLLDGPSLGIERHMVLLPGSYIWTLRCMRRAPWLFIPLIRREIVRQCKRHSIERIYAHFPNHCFLVAAWQASEYLGLPLTVYFDILWEEGTMGMHYAAECESRIVNRADSVFAITEFAVKHLEQKHGKRVNLVPHVIDTSGLPSCLQALSNESRPVILYSGAIYPNMNQDSLERLAQASTIARTRPIVDLCTWSLPDELRRLGMRSRCLSRARVMAAQAESSILFMPLAFESKYPVMIRNNCAIKLMDYLCSGRPILVHAPADCYVTYIARREGFALVVDRPSVTELAAAIDLLVRDRLLQERLVAGALTFVRTRDSRVWAQRLWAALSNN